MTITRRSALAALAGASLTSLPLAVARAEGTLDEVKKRGSLRVGVTQAPPWYSKDPKTGQWSSGLGVFMGEAMAKTLGVKFEPVEVSWGNAIAALQGDKIDLMFVLDATAERKQAVDFPEAPLLYYSLAVLARDDLPVKTWDDLDKPGLKISCAQATTIDTFLTAHTPKADIQRFPGNVEAIAAFQAGRVDAVGMFHPPLLAARQKLGKGKLVVPTPAQSVPSSVAVRKGDTAFVAWVDKAIGAYYQGGQSEKWYEQSLADFGLDPKTVPPIMKELIK
jgi:polar amino acid transport system substrate-binding protein